MVTASKTFNGIVHGKIIELEKEPGFPDGQKVSIIMQPTEIGDRHLPPGEGILRSAGAWADDAEELDEYLDWSRRQRKLSRPEILE